MREIMRLQELMLNKNLVIRALPKEVEYKFIYNSGRKKEYDKILRTNSTARIERNSNGVEYIVYSEDTMYNNDSFIMGIKNNTDSTVASWDWLKENNELVIFNSLKEILDYFE